MLLFVIYGISFFHKFVILVLLLQTGCIDETGQCYRENATKLMDNSCLKYKCYEDRIMRLEGKVLSHRPDMEQN